MTTPAIEALISELEYAILGASFAGNFGRIRAAKEALRAALNAPQPADAADGWVRAPVELIKDALESLEDYRSGLGFGTFDRKLIGRLKAVLPAPPSQDASKGGQS